MKQDACKQSEGLAAQVRAAFLDVPGNEHALDGIKPSDLLVDANSVDSNLTGCIPEDVARALFAGGFKGGVPSEFEKDNPLLRQEGGMTVSWEKDMG